jgi:hypothetical protein
MNNPTQHSLAHTADTYWTESRQPWTSLVFIAPLLALYEAGVLLLQVQNGADVWMRKVLDLLGFGQHFLLPILTVGILLGWQHLSRHSWRVSLPVLSAMAVECVLLAFVLRFVLQLQNSLLHAIPGQFQMSIADTCKNAVVYLGAGIYEELLFRLILLSLALWLLRRMGLSAKPRAIAAVVATSLLFAEAHYVGSLGDDFHWDSFIFRFLAGVFFSILFLFRGFGITAGAHAAYDILVGLF